MKCVCSGGEGGGVRLICMHVVTATTRLRDDFGCKLSVSYQSVFLLLVQRLRTVVI